MNDCFNRAEMEWDKFAMVLFLMTHAPHEQMGPGKPLDATLWEKVVGVLTADEKQIFLDLSKSLGASAERLKAARDLLCEVGQSDAWTTDHFISTSQLRELWTMGRKQAQLITMAAREAEKKHCSDK